MAPSPQHLLNKLNEAERDLLTVCGWQCLVVAPNVALWRDPEDNTRGYFYSLDLAIQIAKARIR